MSRKLDGIVEAVRYKGGQILFVRAYERRGATYSDRLLLPRKALIERLRAGRQFYTGRRRELLASTFDVDKPIRLQAQNGHEVIATRGGSAQDELEGVPIL